MRSSSRIINGIDVQFPFETPYPAQIMVASKVLTALQKRQNALIESPTGTGKSLALLCSILAYQKSFNPHSDDIGSERKIPPVYYMSRTHSQLTQVVKELGRTVYRPKMTILGSRDQLCVRKRTGVPADENCHNLMNEGACEHYFNTYRLRSALERSDVFDIEDLVKAGTSLKACPYFTTRSLARPPGQAKLILCPYNYVVDMAVRRSLGLDLKGAVLVFDEAHNIESVARDAASSTYQIPYLQAALDSLHDVEDSAGLRSALQGLVEYMGHCSDSMTTISFEHDAHVESGQRMLDILSEFGLGSDSLAAMRSSIQTLTARYREDPDSIDGDDPSQPSQRRAGGRPDGVDPSRVMAALRLCETLCSTLELLYRDGATQHYRLALTRKASDLASSWEYSLSFWCLSPSIAMQCIAKDAASIIVASGTLFPLGSFAAELGVVFEQKVEAPHVISSDQVWVGVVPDVCNRHLTSTYNFVNTLDFQDQLIQTLIGLARTIPAGMLVFLPSYSLLDKLLTRWRQTKQFAGLNRIKSVLIENRRSGADFDATIQKYRRLCASKKGAIFFGVFRGKLSEGIDFSNDDARAVVCVGIPYPNTKEAQVALKQAHNTALLRSDPSNPIPNGREWYSQQAYRALNQSLGRCIRHSQDYGAIIFIDARFQHSDVMSNVSKWVRKESVTYQSFSEAVSKLDEFFSNMAVRFPISHEPEWKVTNSKQRIEAGPMDSYLNKWSVKKRPKSSLSPELLEDPVLPPPSTPIASEAIEIRRKPSFFNNTPAVVISNPSPPSEQSPPERLPEPARPAPPVPALSSLDRFSYQADVRPIPVCDLTDDPPPPPTTSLHAPSITFNCRQCGSVLWNDPGQYGIRNQARNETQLVLNLFRPKSLGKLRPMDGYNDLNVVYDFPSFDADTLAADHNSLVFNAELGLVLRRLSCRSCNDDIGGELIAANRCDLIESHIGRAWILGAVIVPGRNQVETTFERRTMTDTFDNVEGFGQSLTQQPDHAFAAADRNYLQRDLKQGFPEPAPSECFKRDYDPYPCLESEATVPNIPDHQPWPEFSIAAPTIIEKENISAIPDVPPPLIPRESLQQLLNNSSTSAWLPCKRGKFVKR